MAFVVNYVDDDYRKHICVAQDMREVNFIIKRFDTVSFYKASDKEAKALNPKIERY